MLKIHRQGDVLFIERSAYTGKHSIERHELRIHGENGHTHVLEGIDMPDSHSVVAEHRVTMTHEEHPPLTLEPGTYEVRKAREFINSTRSTLVD